MENINSPELIQTYYEVSVDCEDDEYNDQGVNISSQKRRQALISWTKVVYKKKIEDNYNKNTII